MRSRQSSQIQAKTDNVTFTSFSVGGKEKEGTLIAYDSKNCDYTDGCLKNGVGLAYYVHTDGKIWSPPVSEPEIFQFFFCTEKGTFAQLPAYITKKGAIYCYDTTLGGFKKIVVTFPLRAFEVIDKDENPFIVLAGKPGIYTFEPDVGHITPTGIATTSTVGCVWKNRFFCVSPPFTVLYSEPLNAKVYTESVEEGGRIVFPSSDGKIVAMKAFENHVYIFYEYGLAKLEIGGSPRDFKLTKIGYGGGKIFGDSVGVCSVGGEKVFFLTENGLYRLSEDKVEKICKNLPIYPKRQGQVCAEAESEGKYFVGFIDENGENVALCVDAEKEKGYFFFNHDGLSSWRGETFCFNSRSVRVLREGGSLPKGETCYFNAEKIPFGETGLKTVKSLRFFGKGTIDVLLTTDGKEKNATLTFVDGEARMRCDLRGEYFSLKITLRENTAVTALQVETVKLKK